MKALLFSALLFSFPAYPHIIDKCGIYVVEGLLESNQLFIADKESESEIKIELTDFPKEYQKYLHTQITAEIYIHQQCQFSCRGVISKVVRQLEPFEKAKSFVYPRPKAKLLKECLPKSPSTPKP